MNVINEAKAKVYKRIVVKLLFISGFIGDGFTKGSLRIFQGNIP